MKVDMICSEESGQGMVEYGLILLLVALVVVGTLTELGKDIVRPMYELVTGAFDRK